MSDPVTFRNPPEVAPPIGSYHHIAHVKAGTDLLFISGQLGVAPDGTLPDTPEDQYANALRNVVAILKSEGGTPSDIVKVNTYLVRPMALDRIREIRLATLGEAAPAATLVYVPRLASEDYLVEVEAVVAKRR